MTKKEQIEIEAREIYFAIKEVMRKYKTDYCQSWWLNIRNFDLQSKLSTPKINQRCKLLIRQGYLRVDKKLTSTHTGTSYKLTQKELIQ